MDLSNIYVDTNILIDILSNREPFSTHSEQFLISTQNSQLCISAQSVMNAWYVSKAQDKQAFYDFVSYFKILELTKDVIKKAVKTTIQDLEDAVEVVLALNEDCEVCITRDKELLCLELSEIAFMTPEEFVEAKN